MGRLDDVTVASNPRTLASDLLALSTSPWWDVRKAVATNSRLPLYALHRLCLDPNTEVSTAACLVLARESEADIRAALKYDPTLTRAVLRACEAYDRPSNGYAMPEADFSNVMTALGLFTSSSELVGMPRQWVVLLVEPQ